VLCHPVDLAQPDHAGFRGATCPPGLNSPVPSSAPGSGVIALREVDGMAPPRTTTNRSVAPFGLSRRPARPARTSLLLASPWVRRPASARPRPAGPVAGPARDRPPGRTPACRAGTTQRAERARVRAG